MGGFIPPGGGGGGDAGGMNITILPTLASAATAAGAAGGAAAALVRVLLESGVGAGAVTEHVSVAGGGAGVGHVLDVNGMG